MNIASYFTGDPYKVCIKSGVQERVKIHVNRNSSACSPSSRERGMWRYRRSPGPPVHPFRWTVAHMVRVVRRNSPFLLVT